MARKIEDINTQIVNTLVANFFAIGIVLDPTKWSKFNIMRLFCFTFATCAAYLEQLFDVMKSEVDKQVALSQACTALWVQTKMFAFQYSDYIQIINGVPTYQTINTTKQIITACSVTSPSINSVVIKVAKAGSPLQALSDSELSASQGYINEIGTTGINYSVQSSAPDIITIGADVYCQNQYMSTIKADIIATIESFLSNISVTNFNGDLKMTDIEKCILNITGVNDVVLKDVAGRANTVLFIDRILLVSDYDVLIRKWASIAGYCESEITIGSTLNDLINVIGE